MDKIPVVLNPNPNPNGNFSSTRGVKTSESPFSSSSFTSSSSGDDDKIPIVTDPNGIASTSGTDKISKAPIPFPSSSDVDDQLPSASTNRSVDQTSPSDDDSVTTADGIDDSPLSSSTSSSSDVIPMKDGLPSSAIKNQTGPFPLPTPSASSVSYPTPDVPDNPSPRPALNDSSLNDNGNPASNTNETVSLDEFPQDENPKNVDSPDPKSSPSVGKASPDLDVDLPVERPSHVGLNFDIDSTNTHFHMPIGHNKEEGSEVGIHWFEADVELPVCDERSFLDEKVKCRAVLESLGKSIHNGGEV